MGESLVSQLQRAESQPDCVIYSDKRRVFIKSKLNTPALIQLTIRELWVAELQIFACSGRVVLCAHGVFHAFDVLFEVVERAKDVLHAFAVVHDGTGRV